MNVLILGGSRNIGYYSAQRLLAQGATVTFILRRGDVFDNDESIAPYISRGKVRIVEGDALNEADVRRAWETASGGGSQLVDSVLFTVGGAPKFRFTRGFVIDPPDLCTRAMLNLLSSFPRSQSPQPKLISISSSGITASSHRALPLIIKPLYGFFLAAPHEDKFGMERVVAHAAGWRWEDKEPSETVLPGGWKERLGQGGQWQLSDVTMLRPSAFTDGKCTAEDGSAKTYRSASGDLKGAYTISRRDVAHFIVERCLKDWDQWKGKHVGLAY